MKLIKFRVQNFRSVEDSGWIDTDNVTALIGTNESGKTNLLVPLWKLNPAKDGEINPISDYPRKRYNEIRAMEEKPIFIEAQFALSEGLIAKLSKLTGAATDEISTVCVQRDLDGEYYFKFPNSKAERSVPKSTLAELLTKARADIMAAAATKVEEQTKSTMLAALDALTTDSEEQPAALSESAVQEIKEALEVVDTKATTKRSLIAPIFGQLVDSITELQSEVFKPAPQDNEKARKLLQDCLPTFVYYSNYGNLDSEIYLPHVIDNLKRSGLGSKEEAKTRTLKVLFDFVRLSPQEILDLGKDLPVGTAYAALTDAQIKATAEKKKEREILLQSASTELEPVMHLG